MPKNFHCQKDDRGAHHIKKWRADLSKTAKANLDRAMEHLKAQPLSNWERPNASPLGNNIYVIRFKDENRTQWRLYGHIHAEHDCFVASLGGTERGGKYLPANYQSVCEARKSACSGKFSELTEPCLLGCEICTPPTSEDQPGGPEEPTDQMGRLGISTRVHGRLH